MLLLSEDSILKKNKKPQDDKVNCQQELKTQPQFFNNKFFLQNMMNSG